MSLYLLSLVHRCFLKKEKYIFPKRLFEIFEKRKINVFAYTEKHFIYLK